VSLIKAVTLRSFNLFELNDLVKRLQISSPTTPTAVNPMGVKQE
jgi:hypothetical protein